MVTQGLLDFVLFITQPIMNRVPDIDLSGLESAGGVFLSWISVAAYMLPLGTVRAIFVIILSLQLFRIVVSFFKSLWGVLPAV